MSLRRVVLTLVIGGIPCALLAQGPEDIARPRPAQAAQTGPTQAPAETPATNATKPEPGGFKHVETEHAPGEFVVPPGTRILLNMINSVSTRQAAIGDRLYLQTAFPVFANGRGHRNSGEAARPREWTRRVVCALRFAHSAQWSEPRFSGAGWLHGWPFE